MSLANQVWKLDDLRGKLSNSRRSFAESLVQQYRQKRRLSQAQQVWVDKLIDEALNPPAPPPPVEATDLGVNFEKIHAMFDRAASKRRPDQGKPRIKARMIEDGKDVVLERAGAESKNPGSIYVRYGGTYYGKIGPDNRLTIPRNVEVRSHVNKFLCDMAENPSQAGKHYGQASRYCCFCGRGLLTTDSKYYGYGPICADHFGLEWGIARQRIVEDELGIDLDDFLKDAPRFE